LRLLDDADDEPAGAVPLVPGGFWAGTVCVDELCPDELAEDGGVA